MLWQRQWVEWRRLGAPHSLRLPGVSVHVIFRRGVGHLSTAGRTSLGAQQRQAGFWPRAARLPSLARPPQFVGSLFLVGQPSQVRKPGSR